MYSYIGIKNIIACYAYTRLRYRSFIHNVYTSIQIIREPIIYCMEYNQNIWRECIKCGKKGRIRLMVFPDIDKPDDGFCSACWNIESVKRKAELERQIQESRIENDAIDAMNTDYRESEERAEIIRRAIRKERLKRVTTPLTPEQIEDRRNYAKRRYKHRLANVSDEIISAFGEDNPPICPRCKSNRIWKSGTILKSNCRMQRYKCRDCYTTFTQDWSE